MRTAAVIIAGGKAQRLGGEEKLFLEVGGKTILRRVVDILTPQVDRIAINANGDHARFAAYDFPIIPDINQEINTPLAGLQTALHWAKDAGFEQVLTVPSDTPFLPADLVEGLRLHSWDAAIAASLGQAHYLTGLWAALLAPLLDQAIMNKEVARVQDWAQQINAARIEWRIAYYDPFLNINTPDDLALANQIAGEFNL